MSTLIKPFSQDQARGMLIGMAMGAAMGNARYGLAPGQWTGVATQALCMGQMLRSANGWDAEDVMKRFVNWRDHGYLSPTRMCFDLDPGMGAALERFEATRNPYQGVPESRDGKAIARLAAVVIAYAGRVESAVAVAGLQARLTHGDPDSARASAAVAEFMVTGESSTLSAVEAPPQAPVAVGDVLRAAIWALGAGNSLEEVLQKATGLGGDADVVGAVAGQLAGRRHGYGGVPSAWRKLLHDHDKILGIADDLHAMRPVDV
ncbi:ADP-ribosylglycohydrolase [Candidatus Rhodobacter oscarellae]|uniref:ADP-ribosylglycohydrolase n=1 Tax=Candidatus Rhodobacter oscarellae TaxID=1675527 RepID=A0A0J9E9M6_9RHOB|nr:ADP-ribosylglycohydrolase family protein [Candidatus Rhodobacter lobularis]KMW59331.1 ADP-ribosylglycohydrolase [Candidatus Rhodobacter lobularis]